VFEVPDTMTISVKVVRMHLALLCQYHLQRVNDMPTVSVKLAPSTKEQLDRIAASLGTSPHALMVRAIEGLLIELCSPIGD
jgi:hypothetical protein